VGGRRGRGWPAARSVVPTRQDHPPGPTFFFALFFMAAARPAAFLTFFLGPPPMISEYLIASPLIRKVSFTGSVPVGKHLARLCANSMKRYTAELGGHSPVLVFADAANENT